MRVERRYRTDAGTWESSSSYTLSELYAPQHFVGRVIDRTLAAQISTDGEAA